MVLVFFFGKTRAVCVAERALADGSRVVWPIEGGRIAVDSGIGDLPDVRATRLGVARRVA